MLSISLSLALGSALTARAPCTHPATKTLTLATNTLDPPAAGYVGGSASTPDTSQVDAGFSVLRSENNSAGALFEQVMSSTSLV